MALWLRKSKFFLLYLVFGSERRIYHTVDFRFRDFCNCNLGSVARFLGRRIASYRRVPEDIWIYRQRPDMKRS